MLTLGVIGWIIIGGRAGWIGSEIMKTDEQMGILFDIVVGIVGGLLGGFLLRLFGVGVAGVGLMFSFFTCLWGALVLLALVKLVTPEDAWRAGAPNPISNRRGGAFGDTQESSHAVRGRTFSSNEKTGSWPY